VEGIGYAYQALFNWERKTLEYIRLGVHIWVSVLILGTMWRLLQYHLVASQNTTWQHLGRAMALQY